uniref:Uncharacterized protein n=1 Tax=Oryza barthii TaxID=65489 RepID=A0A0D3GFU6_9ORYZ
MRIELGKRKELHPWYDRNERAVEWSLSMTTIRAGQPIPSVVGIDMGSVSVKLIVVVGPYTAAPLVVAVGHT